MGSLQFDAYSSYSDASTPRTPSPNEIHFAHSPHYKPTIDLEHNIFADHADDTVAPESAYWNPAMNQASFAFSPGRGSLLQELYEHDVSPEQHVVHDVYSDQPAFHPDQWSHISHFQDTQPQRDFHMIRRATFPYVRHDREEPPSLPPFQYVPQDTPAATNPYPSRHDALYGEPLPLSADPSSLHEQLIPSSSPHSSYHEFDDNNGIKLEDSAPIIVPSQTAFYPPPSSGGQQMSMSYISPHTGLPVQHTDDAASKETQYLRRRCFNCHTTEPPSWRRSTLNPGKIVCNKCGLYERTHLRPRPLRFDELRAGNKARKQSKGTVSPKAKVAMIKKEPRETYGLVRRSSVSSSSSNHSGGATSDWDDNVSVYSSGSAPPSSFNSPNLGTFSISRDSLSPPRSRDGGIRLPNTPLSDIASLQQQSPASASPRKAHTSPYYSPAAAASQPHLGGAAPEFYRRGSMPDMRQETTGWQSVSMTELAPSAEGRTGEGLQQGPVPTAVAS